MLIYVLFIHKIIPWNLRYIGLIYHKNTRLYNNLLFRMLVLKINNNNNNK